MSSSFFNTQITSLLEYSSTIAYASTSSGSIIEVDTRKCSCVEICSIENDVCIIISLLNIVNYQYD